MKRMSVRLLLMLTVLALVSERPARAELIEYSYSWTVLPHSVIPGTGVGNTGSVQVSLAADGTQSVTVGDSTPPPIPAATQVTTTSAATTTSDSFNTPISMKLLLTDSASGQSDTLTFSGTLAGTLTSTTADLKATFDTNLVTQTTPSLGGHIYTVTIDPALVNVPAPNATALGSIDAFVRVADAPSGGGDPGTGDPGTGKPAGTPEPSSLVLAATAMLGLAARRCARRVQG